MFPVPFSDIFQTVPICSHWRVDEDTLVINHLCLSLEKSHPQPFLVHPCLVEQFVVVSLHSQHEGECGFHGHLTNDNGQGPRSSASLSSMQPEMIGCWRLEAAISKAQQLSSTVGPVGVNVDQ